jgi:hypothetical protein
MKKIVIILISLFYLNIVFSQGITNISISPLNPTESDTIVLSVFQTYTSSGCPLHSKYISLNNNQIASSSLHCIGMMTALCDEVDTFHLAPLPAGVYSYIHTMNSGFGSPDCTPGFVPDDVDSLSFEVASVSGIEEEANHVDFSIFPNPSSGHIKLFWNKLNSVELFLYDFNGKLIYKQVIQNGINSIDTAFASGIYFCKFQGKSEFSSMAKIIVD